MTDVAHASACSGELQCAVGLGLSAEAGSSTLKRAPHGNTQHAFVDFHTRSAFSYLEAASLPEDLVQRASELGHGAMALMDRDNLCGAPRFYMAAKKIGAKAHIGAEITREDGNLYPLLVENRTGYQNLCRLITSMKLRAPKGEAAASQEELERFSAGLV